MEQKNKVQASSSIALKRVKQFLSDYSIIYALIILIIALSILAPMFFELRNFMNVLRQISMIGIITVGIFFVMVSGGIDISTGATVGFAGVMFAKLMVDYGLHPIIAFFITILIGVIIGVFNGVLVTKFGIPAMIATLASQLAIRGVTYVITNAYPISNIPSSIAFLGRGYVFGLPWLPWPVAIMIIIFIIAHFVSVRTKFGRSVYAVGGNAEAAYLSGIMDKNIQIVTYIVCSALAALAGVILCSRLASGQPSGGLGWEFEAVIAAVIGGVSITGGRGKVFGAFFGAFLVGLLTNGMTLLNISSYVQDVVKGLVLIFAIAFDVYSIKKKSTK